ncbi:DUF2975 domain-containing protein [Maribacter litopenaei]|uniref:DUF2975 domain-containing protein n=1 Tax=Maribacter litopenaei TaxID=2976127 RepID=A0ABY5YC91_9FLAO|nr:DUF2975 domain-containing protein [Maribacter litopenaei]UWX56334.1 DUF2975 domain-containing protein [Maribacter litopenaei]
MTEGRAQNLDMVDIYLDPFILYGYAASVVFFFALFKTIQLLENIIRSDWYTLNSEKILRSIKRSALLLAVLILMAGIYIKIFHHKDDDPAGFTALCIIAIFLSIVVATTARFFEKNLQNRMNIHSERN